MPASPIILASASPRRQQLLQQIGVSYELAPQHIDESRVPGEDPRAYACRLAQEKARAALSNRRGAHGAVVLAADTVVVCADQVLGKPRNREDGLAMLAALSARQHQVLTAISVTDGEREGAACSSTEVSFRAISAAEAERYWASGEPAGKAGAYAIQGLGAVFVKHINGSYSGVMGLPLYETAQLLAEFDIPCWQQAGR